MGHTSSSLLPLCCPCATAVVAGSSRRRHHHTGAPLKPSSVCYAPSSDKSKSTKKAPRGGKERHQRRHGSAVVPPNSSLSVHFSDSIDDSALLEAFQDVQTEQHRATTTTAPSSGSGGGKKKNKQKNAPGNEGEVEDGSADDSSSRLNRFTYSGGDLAPPRNPLDSDVELNLYEALLATTATTPPPPSTAARKQQPPAATSSTPSPLSFMKGEAAASHTGMEEDDEWSGDAVPSVETDHYSSDRHHQDATSAWNSLSQPDTAAAAGGVSDGGISVGESVMCAVDMLCDDLFACKTDVLRNFARTRSIHAGPKAQVVLKLIEKAHTDAHGQSGDLSMTQRLLGDVFDGSSDSVRVSGVRSAWTNKSLEASHIEAAAGRHLRFEALTNSSKTLIVRRHTAETSRVLRKLSRPFQESYTKLATAAIEAYEKYYRTCEAKVGKETPSDASSRKKATAGTNPDNSGSRRLPSLTPEQLKALREEMDLLVRSQKTSDILSPFAAFLVSYIRYGAAINLMMKDDVNERLQHLGVILTTIEEEDAAPASSAAASDGAGAGGDSANEAVRPRHGLDTLEELIQLLPNVITLASRLQETFKNPNATAVQRINYDSPEMIVEEVALFQDRVSGDDGQSQAPGSPTQWRVDLAPEWVRELAHSFVNWEMCVRADLVTFRDFPSYIFDTILAGVVHYSTLEHIYGRGVVDGFDIVMPLRASVKKALMKHFNGDEEAAQASIHELIAYVNSAMDTTRGLKGEFYIQVLSQMRGVFSMNDDDKKGSSELGNWDEQRVSKDDEEESGDIEFNLDGDDEGEDNTDELLGLLSSKPKKADNNNSSTSPAADGSPTAIRNAQRVAAVMKEVGRTAGRCTRSANLFDILTRIVNDLHFHFRFSHVFGKLNGIDRSTVRVRQSLNLPRTLDYFEREYNVDKPISVECIAFLATILLFLALRPHDGQAPVVLRYPSVIPSATELTILGLRDRGTTSVKELRVAFPPQLTYQSWLHESVTKDKSVYKVLPSVAVKGPTNEAMIVSQAPMMVALDAISKVPWRIHKYVLHVQEAMVREGYGFGKIRPAFYPLHYTAMHPGVVHYKPTLESSSTSSIRMTSPSTPNPQKHNDVEAGNADPAVLQYYGEMESGRTLDGEVVGCNIQQRMRYDQQMDKDWKDLSDIRSSRIHYLQALRQARSLVQFSHVYFPNSMDFRGRMYPLPGRLNHTGSDPFRALLEYAEPKPLGKTGLYWLKVHVANKMGMSKLSFDERAAYVDEHTADIVQSAESPLQGDRWWQEASEPLQCLMACKELADALKYSQGAEHFPSRLPVAVDGSYNGLQHYSAIGRDLIGAKLVNLVPSERPADAYTGILKEMMKVIEVDAAHDHPVAQRCLGTGKGQDKNHIKRKTIKRPIMTQVYGITSYGMAEQIFDELTKQNKSHGLWTRMDMKEMARYLKDKVLDSLGITFKETQRCREWISVVSNMVYAAQPPELRNALCWTTPLGLVVRQPYRVRKESNLFTTQGYTRVPGDAIGAAGRKQLTAMAPNLIHSLDATHLAMTALAMQQQGLSMMAVHDSYWTYACDLPVLSQILRTQFVNLYTQHDPLWELKEQWEEAFFFDLRRHGLCLPDPPERGELDLNVVLDSQYFFS